MSVLLGHVHLRDLAVLVAQEFNLDAGQVLQEKDIVTCGDQKLRRTASAFINQTAIASDDLAIAKISGEGTHVFIV